MNPSEHPAADAWLMYPTWLGYSETLPLERPADAYVIEEIAASGRWICRAKDNGSVAYEGAGPIRIIDEPIPF
ncbi:hypothetical protein [Paracidovorax wautersii]|nr:hypothetical protein [Paracidovorax wautersii]